ncbi:MAG: PIN domain-containing protein [Chloroflexi bacterium]|nr:PIN domain-containing protein [Chloroflexota bacterium]
MAREVFVDAGAWIALSDAGDQYHGAAVEAYHDLSRHSPTFVTTNLVIAEAYVLIRRAAGHPAAMRFLRALRQSSRLLRIYSDAALEQEAEEVLARYADQDISFVDAVSFVVMRERGITDAFAFDRHFLAAGFVLQPAPP